MRTAHAGSRIGLFTLGNTHRNTCLNGLIEHCFWTHQRTTITPRSSRAAADIRMFFPGPIVGLPAYFPAVPDSSDFVDQKQPLLKLLDCVSLAVILTPADLPQFVY
jgi:hypothetical protein